MDYGLFHWLLLERGHTTELPYTKRLKHHQVIHGSLGLGLERLQAGRECGRDQDTGLTYLWPSQFPTPSPIA